MMLRACRDPNVRHIVEVDDAGGRNEGGSRQDVARHLRAILSTGEEDTFIFITLPIVRGMRIVVATVVGDLPFPFLVGMPMVRVLIATSHVLRIAGRAHHVGMLVVPAAPEQAVGDESCRRQNSENESEHERNPGMGTATPQA